MVGPPSTTAIKPWAPMPRAAQKLTRCSGMHYIPNSKWWLQPHVRRSRPASIFRKLQVQTCKTATVLGQICPSRRFFDRDRQFTLCSLCSVKSWKLSFLELQYLSSYTSSEHNSLFVCFEFSFLFLLVLAARDALLSLFLEMFLFRKACMHLSEYWEGLDPDHKARSPR